MRFTRIYYRTQNKVLNIKRDIEHLFKKDQIEKKSFFLKKYEQ